jgi:hypothetical protein
MSRHLGKSIRPSHAAIVRAPGLLPMRYTLREISEQLEVPLSTLKDWRMLEMPWERDEWGHIWIQGTAFAAWLDTARHRRKQRLKAHEAYCVVCHEAVVLLNPSRCDSAGVARLTDHCPKCGNKITRVIQRWSTEKTTNLLAPT